VRFFAQGEASKLERDSPLDYHPNNSSRDARVYIIKVVNVATTPQHLSVGLKGIGRLTHCEATLFHSDRPTAVNTISMPDAVQPKLIDITPKGNNLPLMLPSQSFLVVRCR